MSLPIAPHKPLPCAHDSGIRRRGTGSSVARSRPPVRRHHPRARDRPPQAAPDVGAGAGDGAGRLGRGGDTGKADRAGHQHLLLSSAVIRRDVTRRARPGPAGHRGASRWRIDRWADGAPGHAGDPGAWDPRGDGARAPRREQDLAQGHLPEAIVGGGCHRHWRAIRRGGPDHRDRGRAGLDAGPDTPHHGRREKSPPGIRCGGRHGGHLREPGIRGAPGGRTAAV